MNPSTEEKPEKKLSFTTKLFNKLSETKSRLNGSVKDLTDFPASPRDVDRKYTFDMNDSGSTGGVVTSKHVAVGRLNTISSEHRKDSSSTSPEPISPDMHPTRTQDYWSPGKPAELSNTKAISRNPTTKSMQIDTRAQHGTEESRLKSPGESKSGPSSPSLKAKILKGLTNKILDSTERSRRPSNLNQATVVKVQSDDDTPPLTPPLVGRTSQKRVSPVSPDLPTVKQANLPEEPRNKIQIDTPKPVYMPPPPLDDTDYTRSNEIVSVSNSPLVKPKNTIKVTVRGIENLQLDTKPPSIRDTYSPSPNDRKKAGELVDDLLKKRKSSARDQAFTERAFSATALDMEPSNRSPMNPATTLSTPGLLDDKKPTASPRMSKRDLLSMSDLSTSSKLASGRESLQSIKETHGRSTSVLETLKESSMARESSVGAELASRVLIGKLAQFQIDKPKSTYPPSLDDFESDSALSVDLEGKKMSTASLERTNKFKGIVKGLENVVLDTKQDHDNEVIQSTDMLISKESISRISNSTTRRKKAAPTPLNVNTTAPPEVPQEDHSAGPLAAMIYRKNRFSFIVGGMPTITDDNASVDTVKLNQTRNNEALAIYLEDSTLLPLFMSGVYLCIDPGIPSPIARLIARHVFAYDGNICNLSSAIQCTHYCTLGNEEEVRAQQPTLKIVSPHWVFECHKQKKLIE